MVEFERIEKATWIRFGRQTGIQFGVLLVIVLLISTSRPVLINPVLLAVILAVLIGFIEYCLRVGPNLRNHSEMKREPGSDYRDEVERTLGSVGLATMINQNWFVAERKRRA